MAEYGVSTTNLFDLLGDGDGASAPKRDGKKKAEQKVKNKEHNRNKPKASASKTGGRTKREFDRRSGTGRGKEGSKGGHGRNNWGAAGEDDREGQRGPNYNNRRSNGRGGGRGDRRPRRNNDDRRNNRRNQRQNGEEQAEKPAATGEEADKAKATEDPAAEGDAAVEEEKEPVEAPTFTYDEYLQKTRENAVEGDKIELRRAENDDTKWQSAKVKEVVAVHATEEKYLACAKPKGFRKKNKAKKQNTKVSIDEFAAGKVAKSQRGRGRGQGQRGGRGNNRNTKPQNLNDASAFPALGGK